MAQFKGLFATQEDGKFQASIQQIDRGALTLGELLIRVLFSSLNYKDGLAVTGRPGVIRKFPMIPGIDLAGVVEESHSPEFKPGEAVIVTGGGLSETLWGGYSELARVPAAIAVPLPAAFTLKQAMGIGTAGFTAMQSVLALERQGIGPERGEILVTGASGGLGSIAVAILSKLSYRVTASTGRAEFSDYLRSLGATQIISRTELTTASKRPLETERWAGAIDSLGGDALAAILRTLQTGGSVASCGLAGGANLNTSVFPFILRGVNLLGINSVTVSKHERRTVWARLARDLSGEALDLIIREEPLEKIFELGEQILAGKIRGRTVIRIPS